MGEGANLSRTGAATEEQSRRGTARSARRHSDGHIALLSQGANRNLVRALAPTARAMAPLRMKETTDQHSLDKAARKAARQRKREQKDRSSRRHATPPRARPVFSDSFLGFSQDRDESATFATLEDPQRREDEAFEERLRDAMEEDAGTAWHEDTYATNVPPRWSAASGFSYGSSASAAMGRAEPGLEAMDEEEYAEFIRAGIWRSQNRESIARAEEVDRARKVRMDKEAKEREKSDRIEREKIRKLEIRVKKGKVEDELKARERYENSWTTILATPAAVPFPPPIPSTDTPTVPIGPNLPRPANALSFTSFPWPLYPPVPFPPLSWPKATDLTSTTISTFLLSHLGDPAQRKKALRQAVLSYHPDRFERLVGRVLEDEGGARERVRALGLRCSQVLNELLKEENA